MRCDSRDAYYLHCTYPEKEKLEKLCLLTRDEQKFLYALTILYTEDNFFLHCAGIGTGLIGLTSAVYLFLRSMCNEYLRREKKNIAAKYKKLSSEMIERMQGKSTRRLAFFKGSSFVLLSVLATYVYWEITGSLSRKLEKSAHETVSKLGPTYAKSGSTYYEKCQLIHAFLSSQGIPKLNSSGEDMRTVLARYPRALTYEAKRAIYQNEVKQLESS